MNDRIAIEDPTFDASRTLGDATPLELAKALLSKSPIAVIGSSSETPGDDRRKMMLLVGGHGMRDKNAGVNAFQLITELYVNTYKRLREEFDMPIEAAQYGLMQLLEGISKSDDALTVVKIKHDPNANEPGQN